MRRSLEETFPESFTRKILWESASGETRNWFGDALTDSDGSMAASEQI